MDKIRFNGVAYPIREVAVEEDGMQHYYFSVESLNRKLSEATKGWSLDDCANSRAHEAYKIDSEIDFYVKDEKELTELSDEELINLIN